MAPCPTIDYSQSPSCVTKHPKALSFLLTKDVSISIPASTIHNMVLEVADIGATDHMPPEQSAFISYHPVTNINVHMGSKTLAPVLGKGTTVISLNGKLVLVHNILHVSTRFTPLFIVSTSILPNMSVVSLVMTVWGFIHLPSNFCPCCRHYKRLPLQLQTCGTESCSPQH